MAKSDDWRNRSNIDCGPRRVDKISFFYNSRKKVYESFEGTICTVTESISVDFVENTRAESAFPKNYKSIQWNPECPYQTFKDLINRFKQNMKAIKLTHPNYGITELVRTSLADEEPQFDESLGLVVNNSVFRKCMKDAFDAGSSTKQIPFEEFMSGWSFPHLSIENSLLNKDHLEEVKAAQLDLPKMGVVTTIVAFHDYLSELMSCVFDQVYGDVESVNDFLNVDDGQKNKVYSRKNNSFYDSHNPFHYWLRDSKNITEELGQKFESFSSFSRSANSLEHNNNSENVVDEMYEILKSNPEEFAATVQTVLSDYKKYCLEVISTDITMDSIAQVIERILDQNFESRNRSSQMFSNVLNELIQKSDQYFGMIMQVGFNPDKPFNFQNIGMNNENITTSIGFPGNDHINMCVKFRLKRDRNMYGYLLTKQDKENIRNRFREHDGWSIWINEQTRYTVKALDVQTLDHLSRLFCGLKNLFSQGKSEKSRSNCSLDKIPSELKLLAIKNTINPDGERTESFYNHLLSRDEAADAARECEHHLLDIWGEAVKGGDTFTVDYYLYFTITQFFAHLSQLFGQAASCCTWKLAKKKESARFGMDKHDLDHISSLFVN